MVPCEQAQYRTTPQMAPRKTPSADMAMMVMRMGSRVFSMLPGPPSSLFSCERESIAAGGTDGHELCSTQQTKLDHELKMVLTWEQLVLNPPAVFVDTQNLTKVHCAAYERSFFLTLNWEKRDQLWILRPMWISTTKTLLTKAVILNQLWTCSD